MTATRRSRFAPKDFIVKVRLKQWAERKVPNVNIYYETEKFLDHEFRDPHSDWDAAWRNWMRKAAENTSNGTSLPAPSWLECRHNTGKLPTGYDNNGDVMWECSTCHEPV